MKEVNRRNVLKTAGASIAGSTLGVSFIEEARASELDLDLGEVQLLQMVLEHDVGDVPTGIVEGRPEYLLDEANRRVGLLSDRPIPPFQSSGTVVSTGNTFREAPTQMYGSEHPYVVTRTNYTAEPEKIKYLAKPYEHPSVSVTSLDSKGGVVEADGEAFELTPGNEYIVDLSPRTGYVYRESASEPDDVREIEMQPRLTMRLVPDVRVYGTPGSLVVPINREDDRLRRYYNVFLDGESTRIVEKGEADLMVVTQGGEGQ